MEETLSMYQKLGVDPSKENVKATFKSIISNEYPHAFVNIITDPFRKTRVLTKHMDGDGSKFVQRLLLYYETRNPNVFAGMVDDAFSMNMGDIAASGFVSGPIMVADVLNCGPLGELKEIIMGQIAKRFKELFAIYKDYGFEIKSLGGETADLPDQVKTAVFDVSVTAWANKRDLITGNVKPGDTIYGFHSDGKAAWEDEENSGIMSNGLTMARSCLMSEEYNLRYPELKRDGDFFAGHYFASSKTNYYYYDVNGVKRRREMSPGKALISPTRQWAIVIKEIISELQERRALKMLHGITMNTAGGATKILNVGSGIHYEKHMPFPMPPIFNLIQEETGESWKNMYETFNCGIGIDVIGEDDYLFFDCLEAAAKKCRVKLSHLGYAKKNGIENKNRVTIDTPNGVIVY